MKTVVKSMLKIVENKLQAKVDACNPLNNWGDPTIKKMLEKGYPVEDRIDPSLKKERAKYSTYLSQVKDIISIL